MKRLLALLLTAAMIMGMIVLPAAAVTVVTEDTQKCPHCGTAWNDCNWSAWVVEDPTVTVPGGHYYLDADVNMTTVYKIGTREDQGAELAQDVCIDLRGYSMIQATDNRRAFYVYNYSRLSIMDTVGGGKVIGTGRTDTNGAGGTIYSCANAIVDLYSGTLVNAQKDKNKNGGVAYVAGNSTFNVHNGIVDGSGVTVTGSLRGAAFQVAGTLNISGGLVIGGNTYQGGTIAVSPAGKVYISGGTVMGGRTDSHGGSIYSQGLVEISGGLVTGGYSEGRGGNIYSSSTEKTAKLYIKGGVIENGQSSAYGGNISVNSDVFEITGGTIRGNVYSNTATAISGKPVIDNCGYEGLQLASGKLLTVTDLEEGARIILCGGSDATYVAMTDAGSPNVAEYLEKNYLIPASRYGLKVEDGILMGNLDDNGYCPHCQQEVTWEVYTEDKAASGHYYIPTGGVALSAGSAGLTIAEGVEIVLNLAHGSAKPAAPYQVAGSLSVLSTAGSIGRIYNTSADATTINLTGTLNLYDGILGPKSDTETVVNGNGGVIHIGAGATMNMHGGWVMGATAALGGAIYLEGTANSAGKRAILNMENGVITDGKAPDGGGGNIYMMNAKVDIHGGLILNGSAKNAGNIYNNTASALNIYGGIIAFGSATSTGGNLRHAATNVTTTIYDGLFYAGQAVSGGNCYPNNGKFIMYGGSLVNGVATTGHSGNLYAHCGYYYISNGKEPTTNYIQLGDNDTTDDIPAPQIIGGQAASFGGNVHADGNLKLGQIYISGGKGKNGDDLYLDAKAYISVDASFNGELVMQVADARITELQEDRELLNSSCTTLNGKLYVSNYDMAMLVKSESGALGLAGASLVDNATEAQTWFTSAQEAMDAYKDGSHIRLYAPQNTIQMDQDAMIDVNGTQLTVTGNGTLYGFDSSNDGYDTFGTATVTGATPAASFVAPNGNQYVTVNDNGVTSFHRLGIRIANVTLRPATAGLYYQGVWSCDSILAEKIQSFGVALSTNDMPGTNFATDSDTLYTAFENKDLVSGEARTSVLVQNILKTGATDNNDRGNRDIYAIPYAIVNDGSADGLTLIGNGVSYDMLQVVQSVNRIWPKTTDSQRESVKKLYNMDPEVLDTWNLYNITAYINGTPAVRPLKILTLGHSLALDAGRMINLVAATEGYDQEFIIGTLYYSGCPLYKHVNYLRNDSPEYSLHISSTLTPDVPPNKMPNYTMKMAIEYDDWDIIVMQGGVFEIAYDKTYKDGNIQIIQDYVNQYKTNENAIFAWHMAWAPPTTNALRDKYPYEPNSYYTSYEEFNHDRSTFYKALTTCVNDNIVSDDSFVYLIPSGTAFENALSSYLEETDLHRDYVHASDLSRAMIAYLWYCTLAGVDHLDEIKLNEIPADFLKTKVQRSPE